MSQSHLAKAAAPGPRRCPGQHLFGVAMAARAGPSWDQAMGRITEAVQERPHTFLILLVLVYIIKYLSDKIHQQGQPIYLHGYQKDFLDRMAKARGMPSAGVALESVVSLAMSDQQRKRAVFETVHCVHCNSVEPAAWIDDRKHDKRGYELNLTAAAREYLAGPLLAKVEKFGDPPVKQVTGGPLRTDKHKAAPSHSRPRVVLLHIEYTHALHIYISAANLGALVLSALLPERNASMPQARCCVDWAIKEYALADGTVRSTKSEGRMKSE